MATTISYYENDYRSEAKRPVIVQHETELLDLRARIVVDMLTKWGPVTADENGEDGAGRAKVKPQDPHETVNRACTLVDIAFAQFQMRDWIVEVPTLEEIAADLAAKKEAEEAAKKKELEEA